MSILGCIFKSLQFKILNKALLNISQVSTAAAKCNSDTKFLSILKKTYEKHWFIHSNEVSNMSEQNTSDQFEILQIINKTLPRCRKQLHWRRRK
jgi:hypothetical protein